MPEHLLIVVSGYIGLESAQAMRRFGSRVTIIERNARLAHREDVSEALLDLCRHEGTEVYTAAVISGVEGVSGEGVRLHVGGGGEEIELEGTDLLVASGRTPNTDGIKP